MFKIWLCIFIIYSVVAMDSPDSSGRSSGPGPSNPSRSYSTIRPLTSSGTLRYCCRAGSSAREDKDSESIVAKFDALDKRHNAFFAIFDGHNGKETATIAAQRLHERLRTISRSPVDHLALWWACVDTEFQDIRHIKKEGKQESVACKESGACFGGVYFDKHMCHLLWLGNVRAIVSRKGKLVCATVDQVLSNDKQRRQQMKKFSMLSVSSDDIKQTNGCDEKFMLVPYTASFGDVKLKGIEPKESPRKKEQKGSRLSTGSSVSDDHSSSSTEKKNLGVHLGLPKIPSDTLEPILHNEPGYLPVELESGDVIVVGSPGLWFCTSANDEESGKSVDINVQIAADVWDFLKPAETVREKEIISPDCPENKPRQFQLDAAARYLREAATKKLAGKQENEVTSSRSFIRGKTMVPRCSPSVIVIEYTTHSTK